MSSPFKAGKVIAPDAKFTGEEPDWHGWESWPVEKFYNTRARAIRFYNYYLDNSAYRPMIFDWMKKNGYSKEQIATLRDANANVLPSTVGKLIRCVERGMPSLHPQAAEYFASLPFHDEPPVASDDIDIVHHEIRRALALVYSTAAPEETPEATVKPVKAAGPTPLDRIKERVDKEIISQLENLLDTWAISASGAASINLSGFLRDSKIPAQGCKVIVEWLEKKAAEYSAAFNKEDEDYIEAYSFFPKPELRKIVKTFDSMIADARNHAKIKNSTRKPRQKKVKDANKQIQNLKYQTHSADYSIDSVSPARIPTSQRLYVFNTKTRALGVYYATGSGGFEVKGTSIKAFDVDKSFLCTLRKPKDTLTTILSSTPKQLDKFFDSLKTKRRKANGRLNEQTLLLKVSEHKI